MKREEVRKTRSRREEQDELFGLPLCLDCLSELRISVAEDGKMENLRRLLRPAEPNGPIRALSFCHLLCHLSFAAAKLR